MAKSNLPSVDFAKPSEPRASAPVEKAEQVNNEYTEGYVSRRVDVKLTRAAAIKLRDKLRQLQDTGAKTADGRFVTNRTQAMQWIVENEVVI